MDFNFTDEQQMLRDSVEKFVREHYDASKASERRKLSRKAPGYNKEYWQTFADLGWLGVPFPEEYGGIGGTLMDSMVVMEELGKGLVQEPYFPTVILFGNCLLIAGSETQKQTLIPRIVAGEILGTLAYAEEQARGNMADVATTANKQDGGWVLNGVKSLVMNADSADYFVVSARTSGKRNDSRGVTLFLVNAKAAGVTRVDYPTVDCLRASEVNFENVKVAAGDVLGEVDGGHVLLDQIVDRAVLALSAEALGMMENLYKDTASYTSQRVQFGHALSQFQTVKHRIVEMFVESELVRSLLYRATMEAQGEHADAKRDMHALKFKVGKAGRFVGQSAVQLHGGMGQTEELRIGHYFIRLAAIDAHFGDKDYHLARYTDMMTIPTGEADANMMPF